MTEVKGSLAFSYDFATQTFSVNRIPSGTLIESKVVPEMTIREWGDEVENYNRIYNHY